LVYFIWENIVIGFDDYTPPLLLLYKSTLPHPLVAIIVMIDITRGLFTNYLTTGLYTKPVIYLPNKARHLRPAGQAASRCCVRYTVVYL